MKSHILLTGATGLIGSRWLQLLLAANPERAVTVLVRNPAHAPVHSRVRVLVGDLCLPRLGRSDADWGSLGDSLTGIVHCAADVRFHKPIHEARRVNTVGTSTLVDLAFRTPHLEKFVHVSTTYIQGREEGVLPEAPFVNSLGFFSSYEESKYEAECLVLEAMRKIPAAIFRLSSIIGHSQTGRVSQLNYFHQLLRLIPFAPFPIMPGVPGCRVDLIPEDWAVAALSCLFEKYFEPGAVHNICAGPHRSVPVEQLLDAAYERFPAAPRPTMVSLPEFERFAEDAPGNGAREPVQTLLRAASYCLPHLAIRQTFENRHTTALLQAGGVGSPDADFWLRVLNYCAGPASRPSSADVFVPSCQPVG